MRHSIIALFTAIICFATPLLSYAATKSPLTREFPYIMQSVAALGMGNAFYGVSNNKYAGFYNPAGLKYVDHYTVDIIPITLGINSVGIDKGGKLLDIYNKNKNNMDDPEVLTEIIDLFLGKYANIGPLNFYPAYTNKNFSAGIFMANSVNILAYNKVLPELAFKLKTDVGATVSYAMQFLENDALSVGVSLKGLYRVSFAKSYTAVEMAGLFASGSQTMKDLEREIRNEGTGWAILGTIGVMYDLPFLEVVKPRIGVSFNDFGYTDFGKLVEDIDPTLNLSVAISPEFFGFIKTDLVVDFNDVILTAGYDKSFAKRFNVGLQIGFWDHLFIRAGLHQGYPTAGIGFDAIFLRMDYAYYTEELGAYAGQYRDERHAIELAIGF